MKSQKSSQRQKESKKELRAIRKLSGIIKVSREVSNDIVEHYNGYSYVKKHF